MLRFLRNDKNVDIVFVIDLFFSCGLREPQPDKVFDKKENPFRVWNFERVIF
ncbi:hypothetical protein SAMN05421825_2156 [Epilithonimonas hungarica]|uniref:Uncharacterized protein n=1 Tax=Epilithonimonas hungarica TaxID=454006 RepID=A0A1G7P2E9_9FLAO|nr:hypothetical protein SAMN05421825_2156 [Epilithonimonas hungarica]